jgi:hypothetical protein
MEWGTTLVLDHTAKPMPGVNLSAYRPYGSQFKWAQSRCIVQVLRADSGKGVVLRPAKSNFGPLEAPKGATVEFDGDRVIVAATELTSDELSGVDQHLPAVEQTYRALLVGPATPNELAEATGAKVGTVRNHLTALRQQGRAQTDGGRWQAIPDSRFSIDQESGTSDPGPTCMVCNKLAFGLADGEPYCTEHIPSDRTWGPLQRAG